MFFPRRIIYFISALYLCSSPVASAVDSITFASGAPLDDYQASVILPVLTAAFAQQSIEFSAVYVPSLRALKISNSGMLDGELHRVGDFHKITFDKYNNLIKIDHKLLSVYLAVFTKKNITIKTWSDLNNYALAYYRGRKNVDTYLKHAGIKHRIYKVNTDEQAFHMLATNKVDVVISESYLGNSLINSSQYLRDIKEIKRLDKTDIYAYIHSKHQSLIPALLKSLKQMKSQSNIEITKPQLQQKPTG